MDMLVRSLGTTAGPATNRPTRRANHGAEASRRDLMGDNDMKIKKITNRNRRDFTALYVCEHCGWENTRGGYDDTYFHHNVIPDMKCGDCGKKTGENYIPCETRYPDSFVI